MSGVNRLINSRNQSSKGGISALKSSLTKGTVEVVLKTSKGKKKK